MNARRVLIVGSRAQGALEHAYAAGFRAHGVDIEVFDPEGSLTTVRRSRVLNRLTWQLQHFAVGRALEARITGGPSADAVLVFKGYFLPLSAIRRARAASRVPWLNFNPDSPFDPGRSTSSRHIRAALREYDAYLTWSRALVTRLSEHGVSRPVYLPFAYDPNAHFPSDDVDPSLAEKVVFVGSYDSQRAELLLALADLPLVVYGNAWDRLPSRSPLRRCIRGPAIFGAELRRVVTSSLATINILRPQNVGSHNMRTFEVPAMGGLMLTSRSEEQQAFFPDRVASLMYSSAPELREIVQGLIHGRYDTTAIRARAREGAQQHSYPVRARAILDVLGWPSQTHDAKQP